MNHLSLELSRLWMYFAEKNLLHVGFFVLIKGEMTLAFPTIHFISRQTDHCFQAAHLPHVPGEGIPMSDRMCGCTGTSSVYQYVLRMSGLTS